VTVVPMPRLADGCLRSYVSPDGRLKSERSKQLVDALPLTAEDAAYEEVQEAIVALHRLWTSARDPRVERPALFLWGSESKLVSPCTIQSNFGRMSSIIAPLPFLVWAWLRPSASAPGQRINRSDVSKP
jgi:hypothetical protein